MASRTNAPGAVRPGGAPRSSPDLRRAFALMADMTQAFADSMDIASSLQRALERIVEQLGGYAGAIWLLDDAGGDLVCEAAVGPRDIVGTRLRGEEGVVRLCVSRNQAQVVPDVREHPAFRALVDDGSGLRTRSLICAPLAVGDQVIGAVEVLDKEGGGRFAEEDLHPLRVLASSAAMAIANTRLAAAAGEAQRVQRELALAAEIQRSLLPSDLPRDFPVAGANVPARTVSGDFFDILPMQDGCIAFTLGDVAGKGMNAALLMAKTASLYRCLAKSIRSPGRLLRVLNDELASTATRGMFVTMAAGLYDPRSGVVTLANAGHEPPLYRAPSGEFHAIEALEPPLGILEGVAGDEGYTEAALKIDGGGSLYVFSDGITESETADGRQLGSLGLQRLVSRYGHLPLAEAVDAVIAEVQGLRARDDLTLLAVCRGRG